MDLLTIFLAVALAIGLFALGFSVGILFENTRMRALQAMGDEEFVVEELQDPLPELLQAQTDELKLQTKRLDTLIMNQLCPLYSEDPEVTQEIPKVE